MKHFWIVILGGDGYGPKSQMNIADRFVRANVYDINIPTERAPSIHVIEYEPIENFLKPLETHLKDVESTIDFRGGYAQALRDLKEILK